MHDDFTVGVSLEYGILVFETLSESDMVVDFTVNGKDETFVFVGKGLSTGVYENILSAPPRQYSSHSHWNPFESLNFTERTLSHIRQWSPLD